LKGLLRKVDEPASALHLLQISGEAGEATETYTHRTTERIHEQKETNEQMQSMVAMRTDTVAVLLEREHVR
jgi:hypothetical protein